MAKSEMVALGGKPGGREPIDLAAGCYPLSRSNRRSSATFCDKPHWLLLTDAAEIAAVKDAGKYRAITWQRRHSEGKEEVWVLVDAVWTAWRADRNGNRNCRHGEKSEATD